MDDPRPRAGWWKAAVLSPLLVLLCATAAQADTSPSPSPSDSPAPTASASPSPSPTASPSEPPSPGPAPSASPTPGPTPSASPTATASPSPSPPPPPSAVESTLSASGALLAGFGYAGPKTVSTPAGPVETLEFTISSATLTAVDLQLPCTGQVSLEISQPPSGTTSASGLTLDVVSLQLTVAGVSLSYGPSAPPSVQLLPPDAGTLTGLRIVTVSAVAAQLAMSGATIQAHAC
ncbi:MAG: hypothetical protein J2P45_32020 [Candidatus Dormibacteraeota bacterium]|nr:hypothetical protein [Candidatus Dormibacteraeota bacterium]